MKQLLFLLFIGVFLFSCKKEDPAPSKADMLARTWQLDELGVVAGSVSQIAYKKGTSSNPTLAATRMVFKADGSITGDISTSATPIAGKWKLINNDTQLEITNGTLIYTYSILRLTAANLDYSENYTAQGIATVITYKLIPL